jgi:hypothetical protein
MGALYLLDTHNENIAFLICDLGKLECAYPQPVRSCGLWVAKTTQFKRIARRNEQDANEIRIG